MSKIISYIFAERKHIFEEMNDFYGINALLDLCIEDMRAAAASGKITMKAQDRAYDAFTFLSEYGKDAEVEGKTKEEFKTVYSEYAGALEKAFDEEALKAETAAAAKVYDDALRNARFEAAAAASLHEFAKQTFETWQTAGVFARRRALRELRERAGFRLESHRIGNYVAKTFDLMNEAHARFARAQQAFFAADNSYKIRPGIYGMINSELL